MDDHDHTSDGEPPSEEHPHHGHTNTVEDEMATDNEEARVEQSMLEEEAEDADEAEREVEEHYEHGTEHGDHGAEHGDHGSEPTVGDRSIRKLGLVAAINLIGFLIELLGGIVFGSVALLGDAFHMLFDALAYVIALGATVIARRSNPSGRWSYGLHRIEPFAAFLNGILLIPMVLYLLYESYQRYLSPVEINTTMTLLLATGGLIVNLASVYVLQGGEMSLNERGAFYHLLGDAGASVAVIVSMLIIRFTDFYLVDPATAVLIAGLIVWSAVILLRESGAICRQCWVN